ncbi:MAG: SHOCT domain-containing protein [Rubrivivax sp.]|nr:SHOCT domain-containing protein [Rubrivivax sp.]
MTIRSLAVALLFGVAVPVASLAQPAPLLSLADAEGDDDGDGTLVYPREPVAEPGDLDLRSLHVFAERGELRFEATFGNAVRDPAQVKPGLLGNEDLSLFARRGFYAFNLDIYLDVDRVAGSGHTALLPGRRARTDPAHAWERAIVLTPRPELMRRQLRDALVEGGVPAGTDVDATLDAEVFFARDVRVRGRSVSFTVPARFVDAKALLGGSLIAVVTAAKLSIESDWLGGLVRGGSGAEPAIVRLPLGVAAPEAGRPAIAMGYRGTAAPTTAVVDLLAGNGAPQRAQLASGVLSGIAAPGTSPAPGVPAVNPWLKAALAGAGATASPAAAATPALTAAPAARAAAGSAPADARAGASAPAPRVRDAAYLEEQENRLRTLRRLRDANLLTEEEYQRKRREVIDAL